MPVDFHPLRADFGAECASLDLRQNVSPETAREIETAMDRYGVIVFRGRPLTGEQQTAFALNFGTVEPTIATVPTAGPRRLGDALINDISNLGPDNKLLKANDRRRLFNLGNQLWHSDSSFKSPPAKYSMLNAHVIPPEGGDTEFADMRAAWDSLPQRYRDRIANLVCRHSQLFSRSQLGFVDFTEAERRAFAPVRQPLVRRHVTSGRTSLFLSAHIGGIEGWEVPEAMAMIRDLTERATQREFVYRHKWRVGDLVVWDNRCTMHRARPFFLSSEEHPRDLRRVTLEGENPPLSMVA